jgi:protein-export membrane protein SecD
MKRCPTCSRVYDDRNLRFCLDDGSELVNKVPDVSPPTAVLSEATSGPVPTITAEAPAKLSLPPTVASPAQPKPNLIPWLVGGVALMLLLIAVATGAILLRRTRQPLVWHLVLQVDPTAGDRGAAVNQTISVIESRLNAAGVTRFAVRPDGDVNNGRIRVNLPSLRDPERIKSLISAQGKLELVHVISASSPAPPQTYANREEAVASLNSSGTNLTNRRVLLFAERNDTPPGVVDTPRLKKWVVVESPPIIDGSDLLTASAVKATYGPEYDIAFSLRKSGAERFSAWTAAHINQYIGVVLNDEVKSIAFIKSQIFDQGQINGSFTKESAEDLALVLQSGALPAPVRLVEERVDR